MLRPGPCPPTRTGAGAAKLLACPSDISAFNAGHFRVRNGPAGISDGCDRIRHMNPQRFATFSPASAIAETRMDLAMRLVLYGNVRHAHAVVARSI